MRHCVNNKENAETGIFARLRSDYNFRAIVFSAISFFVSLAFAVYNATLGIVYKSSWNVCIAVYYSLLLIIMAFVVISEIRLKKLNCERNVVEKARNKMFLAHGVALFVIDAALIAPISMMVMQKRYVNHSMITAISTAAYTTYKITVSAVNFVKTRRTEHLSVKILKNVNFVDALVSVLSLQYALIMTVDGEIAGAMRTLSAISSFVIWAAIIAVSLVTLIQAVKSFKKKI